MESLVSGRNWERVPPGEEPIPTKGRCRHLWLRDADEPEVLSRFKYADGADQARYENYSIGMERVAYELGHRLDLPIPGVHLERFEDKIGAIVRFVPESVTWFVADGGGQTARTVPQIWDAARYIVFDIWLANADRAGRNILMQAEPVGTSFAESRSLSIVLIDHGFCGLWPPAKFGLVDDTDPGEIVIEGPSIHAEGAIRGPIPDRYWHYFKIRAEKSLPDLIRPIQAISDDQIDAAVTPVPEEFMSAGAKETTSRLLRLRRDDLTRLCKELL